MSRQWTFCLVAITFLGVGALSGALIAPRTVEAAKEAPKAVPPRIAYVNIARVMREFGKAKADGERLMQQKQQIINESVPIREEFVRLSKEIQFAFDGEQRSKLENAARDLKRKLEELEAKGMKDLNQHTDQIVLEVYHQIKSVIAELAEERGLDVVETYPDSVTEEDEKKPAVAQMKLQSPAAYPLFVQGILFDRCGDRASQPQAPADEAGDLSS